MISRDQRKDKEQFLDISRSPSIDIYRTYLNMEQIKLYSM